MRTMRNLAFFAVLASLSAQPALAGPVLIDGGASSGPGQGWIFKHGAECLVATARHVIPNRVGTITTPTGDFGDIASVEFHPELDLAIATVEGRAKVNCPTETLGYKDSRPFLEDASRANRSLTMQYVPLCERGSSNCGTTNVLVKVDSFSPRDAEFFFYPQGGLILANLGGDSGSIIRDTLNDGTSAGQPLGIVIRAATQEGEPSTALVFSEVRKMLDARSSGAAKAPRQRQVSPAAPRASGLRLVDFRGSLADPTCGPLNAIGQSSCTFSARPSSRSQVFEIVVEKTAASNVSEFTFEFAQGSALPSGIEIAAIASSYEGFSAANWTSIRYCRPDAFQFRCRFAPNSSQTFVLRIAGQATIETISVR